MQADGAGGMRVEKPEPGMNPTGCAMCIETGLACACLIQLTEGDEASLTGSPPQIIN